MNQNETVLRNKPFSKLLLNLCVPTIIIMLVMVAYNMADVYFIFQKNGPKPPPLGGNCF